MPPGTTRAYWTVVEPVRPSDTTLEVDIPTQCPGPDFGYVEASENADVVAIYAFKGPEVDDGCLLPASQVHTVELREPLGDRKIMNGRGELAPDP